MLRDGGAVADPAAALAQMRGAVQGLLDRPGYAFSDLELTEILRQAYALAAGVEAVKFAFLQELSGRPEVGVGGPGGRGAVRFLTEGLRVSGHQAGRDLEAAAATRSVAAEVPLRGAALAAGEVSREHLDDAVATVRKIPKVLKRKTVVDPEGVPGPDGAPATRTGVEAIDAWLLERARREQPTTVEKAGRDLRHRLDPERADRFDADAYERSTCAISSDFVGMTMLRLVVDPVNGALIKGAVERLAKPRPAGTAVGADGQSVVVRDKRTVGQRRAEAMVELILGDTGRRPAGPTDQQPTASPEPTEATETRAAGPLGGGAEVVIVARLNELLAGYGPDAEGRRRAATAGLARMTLAGNVGTHTGATIDPGILARFTCDSPLRRILSRRPRGGIASRAVTKTCVQCTKTRIGGPGRRVRHSGMSCTTGMV